jgi:hypothetical protein
MAFNELVEVERKRQKKLHPAEPKVTTYVRGIWQKSALEFKKNNDLAAESGNEVWDDILYEEMAEVFASDTDDQMCTELVQLAALCGRMYDWLKASKCGKK